MVQGPFNGYNNYTVKAQVTHKFPLKCGFTAVHFALPRSSPRRLNSCIHALCTALKPHSMKKNWSSGERNGDRKYRAKFCLMLNFGPTMKTFQYAVICMVYKHFFLFFSKNCNWECKLCTGHTLSNTAQKQHKDRKCNHSMYKNSTANYHTCRIKSCFHHEPRTCQANAHLASLCEVPKAMHVLLH